MNLNPENGIMVVWNGHRYTLSPEFEGQRMCMRIGADRKAEVLADEEISGVCFVFANLFIDAGQPVPRFAIPRDPSAFVRDWNGWPGFAVEEAGDYRGQTFGPYRLPVGKPQPKAGRMLDWFAGWFRGETRERIRAAAADLRKDVRDLRAAGASRWSILRACCWTTATTLVPIVFDRVARIIRAVMSVVREFDGPRPS